MRSFFVVVLLFGGFALNGCGESSPSVPSPTERDELRELMAKEAAELEARAADEDANPE
ncbi:hypothetical protein [Aporhodopirellula aestuarii]|uniref:Secreted protein n=1 Tax=Aporhodopirellula aestuarii TaxID=2950107 RepID=A0ABT0U9J8_9BACT|nr:hypothetical protein [Aporhodopirellula aestuarii]MCM2373563.1 hypothetical protein [Aporhodopirellula aestuarii]